MGKKNKRNPAESLRRALRTFSVLGLLVFLGVVGLGSLFFFSLTRGLPEVSTLKDFRHPLSSEVFSDEGRKIGEFTTERRYPVRIETIPKHVILAFLAAEDSSFYDHKGIDFNGVLRAIVSNVLRGRYAQGGSTITQQVARALLLATKKKEITRKVREMVLAFRMEKELSKNEILSLYLSEIYLGQGAYGIGAAAQAYFGKNVEDLSVAEAALLAGLPQRPNDWNPFHNPHLAKKRQQYVLKRMSDEHFLTPEEVSAALQTPLRLKLTDDLNNKAAPYFTEYVRQYLMGKYGSDRVLTDGMKVYTTVLYERQKLAEKSMLSGLRDVDKRLGWRGVSEKLKEGDDPQAFLIAVHEEILAKETPYRIVSPHILQTGEKKLEFDLSSFQGAGSVYFGETPLREGEYYRFLVQEIADDSGNLKGSIGHTPASIARAGWEWLRVNDEPVHLPSQAFHSGDVLLVRVTKIERRVGTVFASLEQEPEVQGALLSYEVATGNVQAMVGGTDFEKTKFNCALQAKRQVGSTFKPILYAAAMDKGFSPSSIVTDSPIVFKFEGALDADNTGEDWRPHNYGGTFEGDIPLRLALIRSMNIPTVKLLNELTIDYAIEYARRMGITAPLQHDLSIGLGSWSSSLDELTRAYAVFPRLGRTVSLHYIKKIVDASGVVLEDYTQDMEKMRRAMEEEAQADQTVISPQTAYVMTDMLRGVIREGTGRPAFLPGVPIAGKTGTSNDHRDAWFVGYNPFVLTGIWLGYEKDKPLASRETGGKAAAPIWAEYMSQVVKDYPKTDFTIPDDIVFAYVDKQTGRLAGSASPRRVRVAFKTGTVPNAAGENLLRVGEPGTQRSMSATQSKAADEDPVGESETSDYLRQGYQE